MNITVWNEYRHEVESEEIKAVYPNGIHNVIAEFLGEEHEVKTATLDEAEHGLTDEVLAETDVLLWWGHKAHDEVKDEIVEKVKARVLDGMGLIVLHSGHFSKIFKSLMGTTCDLKWREADDRERIWVVDPTHPITDGLGQYIELEKKKCTANTLIYRHQMKQYLSVGLKVEKCLEVVQHLSAETEKFLF